MLEVVAFFLVVQAVMTAAAIRSVAKGQEDITRAIEARSAVEALAKVSGADLVDELHRRGMLMPRTSPR